MQLLRAGVKLASLIDLTQIKPENLEELIDQLNDLTVDVDQKKNKVRVFCE